VAVDSGGVIGNPLIQGKAGRVWFADMYRSV
jgi:hypothetical protein